MAAKLQQNHNSVDTNAKRVVVDLLNARLADAIDLALITKQAHWNLKGPQFIAIHEMLLWFCCSLEATCLRAPRKQAE